MTKTLSAAFLAAALLGSGCVIVNHGQPGDITFVWSFNGRSCSQAGVSSVQVSIPGEALENGGLYACTSAGSDGITLHNFAAGTYQYTLQGLNAGGTVTYQASGSFAIDGDEIVHVDLMPVGGPTSYALLGWTFPANWASGTPNCLQATAAFVDVQIDNGDWTRYACADGYKTNGVASIAVDPGPHTVRLVAVYKPTVDTPDYDIADKTTTITTAAYSPAYFEVQLPWIIGGTSVSWVLYNGVTQTDCTSAGVAKVYVDFKDVATGNYVYGTAGDVSNCSGDGGPPVVYSYLRPGTYEVYTWGDGTLGRYLSPGTGPTITVTAGLFPPANPPQLTLNMVR